MAAGIVSAAVAAIALLVSIASIISKNSSANATQMAKLEVKIDSIIDDLRELKDDSLNQRHKLDELKERFIVLERDQATIWKRIDELRAAVESLQRGMAVPAE